MYKVILKVQSDCKSTTLHVIKLFVFYEIKIE